MTTLSNDDVDNVANFYGCYLLVSRSDSKAYKNRTYIGFTKDPNRRIRQHNGGDKKGGAKRTSDKGPWDMILIVHGFPNKISALRFEWAWQQPCKSRCLKNIENTTKLRKESQIQYRFRIMANMLTCPPWCRLPLTIRWLLHQYECEFPPTIAPPYHMRIVYGPVKPTDVSPDDAPIESFNKKKCFICNCDVDNQKWFKHSCETVVHLNCLAKVFLGSKFETEFIPVSGSCPGCNVDLMWGDVILDVRYS